MWRIALVLLVGCPRHHEPVPCGSTIIYGKPVEAGSWRVAHASFEATLVLPDKQVTAGGGGAFTGTRGPTPFGFTVNAYSKPPHAGMLHTEVKLGDIRALGNGVHPVQRVRVEYRVGCHSRGCPFRCELIADGTVEVMEAEGVAMDHPDVVSPNFHRTLHVRASATNVVGKLMKADPAEGHTPTCTPVSYDLDVTVSVRKADMKITTGMCGGHSH